VLLFFLTATPSTNAQQDTAQNTTANANANTSNSFVSAADYNYCDLCQGLVMLEDVNPIQFPNQTCAMLNEGFRDPSFESTGMHPNSTGNLPGTCRADTMFNAAFEACCEASIPAYECENNVQEYLFGESSSYKSIVPPIVGNHNKNNQHLHQQLNVSVDIQFDALDSVKVEEGEHSL